MRTMIVAAAGVLVVTSPAGASNIQFQLSANVPVLCSVVEVRPVQLTTGKVEVQAVCNLEAFRIRLDGDLAGLQLRSAAVDNGSHTLFQNSVTVRATRPGSFRMVLDYGQDLSDIRFASASIDPL